MTDVTPHDITQLDLRERLVHIDQMLADTARKRQEIRFAPWQLLLAAFTAAAAVLAVGIALGHWMLG